MTPFKRLSSLFFDIFFDRLGGYIRRGRSEKGSNGRTKAKCKLAKLYLKVHNKREDFLHNKEWCCWNCWETNQRDHNSAKNILDEGIRILTSGTEGIAVCLGVRPAQSGLLIGTEAPPSLAAG
jgi:hypothetical protein